MQGIYQAFAEYKKETQSFIPQPYMGQGLQMTDLSPRLIMHLSSL